MSGLTGKSTAGVGRDLVDYLEEVARFFNITIHVTSGFRNSDAQARAMFDNWENLKRGKVYKASTLPEADRVTLDDAWTTAHGKTTSAADKAKAKADFLKLAKDKVGNKSMHSRGRALDVLRTHIDAKVYRAITLQLHEVKEGKRTDIYHFENVHTVPAVNDAMRAKWQAIRDGTGQQPHALLHPPHHAWC